MSKDLFLPSLHGRLEGFLAGNENSGGYSSDRNNNFILEVHGKQTNWFGIRLCNGAFSLRVRPAVNKRIRSPSEGFNRDHDDGYRLWDCALDLIDYMWNNSISLNIYESDVLEIGAGYALPSIAALKLGASTVQVNDVDIDALQDCARANVLGNCVSSQNVRYLGCDWTQIHSISSPRFVDLVLSSDTVYNHQTVPDLTRAAWYALRPGGRALFAFKTRYPDVDGCSTILRDAFRSISQDADIEAVHSTRVGSKVIREVVQITKRKSTNKREHNTQPPSIPNHMLLFD